MERKKKGRRPVLIPLFHVQVLYEEEEGKEGVGLGITCLARG